MATITFNLYEAMAELILAKAGYICPDLGNVIEDLREEGLDAVAIVRLIADELTLLDLKN